MNERGCQCGASEMRGRRGMMGGRGMGQHGGGCRHEMERGDDGMMGGRGMGQHGMHGGWGGPEMRRRRSPRGRVRREILLLLQDGPKHGYELMQLISERNGGVWQPSPGSIYPTLSMLEDTGMVIGQEDEGRKVYTLTEAGRVEAASLVAEPGGRDDTDEVNLGREIRATFQALRQVAMVGSLAQRERAQQMLTRLRRDLYQLLAEDTGQEG